MQAIGLEVQNGYGLIETSPCIAGQRPYYNVEEILRHASVSSVARLLSNLRSHGLLILFCYNLSLELLPRHVVCL
ncbi:hypothetical protein J1N35_012825 [Gossypium stocksii]|uniref:AMP-dependent synthetase/ligase domain-containing protein n=1 Tax=Gossypium stocksii TaxID=47602 RepID=A0A9D3W5H8_9ROSI|nr:hypothetical protein J1N35_012825 [Gossypium stocksii]